LIDIYHGYVLLEMDFSFHLELQALPSMWYCNECTGSYVPFNPVSDSLFGGVDVPAISNYILFKAFTNE
jgi:hypothetical protein